MNPIFIKACEKEIEANTKKKGPWVDWKPSRKEVTQELMWHVAKLNCAVLSGAHKGMQEGAADVANICEKIHRMSQLHEDSRKMLKDHYGDFVGYKGDWREK